MDGIIGITLSYQKSVIQYTVAKLGIADLLKDGPKSGEEIAALAKTKTELTSRFMRAAAAIGIFDRNPDSLKYSLNPISSSLLDSPDSLKWLVLHVCEPETTKAWLNLDKTLVDGSDAFQEANGAPLFEYYEKHPQSSERFNRGMTAFIKSRNVAEVLNENYNFKNIKKIVDVGGGQGLLLQGILSLNPHLSGISFDLPHVVENAKKDKVNDSNLESRFSYAGGSFFESVPEGGDVYYLKTIIHDWDDEKSVEILKTVRKSLPDHGKLLLIEQVIKETGDVFGGLLDLHMMVLLKAKERTEKEFRELFTSAGLKLTRVISLSPLPFFVIEGEKI